MILIVSSLNATMIALLQSVFYVFGRPGKLFLGRVRPKKLKWVVVGSSIALHINNVVPVFVSTNRVGLQLSNPVYVA